MQYSAKEGNRNLNFYPKSLGFIFFYFFHITRGIVNFYGDKKKQGLIEGRNSENVMVYDKDISFLTLLHAGDPVEYIIEKTANEIKVIKIKEITK